MLDIIKKVTFTGLGLAFLTKEKLEELAKEIIEKGKLSEKEGKDFYEELKKRSETAKKDMEEQLEDLVNKAIEKMNLVTKDDVAKLEDQVKELAQAVKGKEAKK